MSIPLDLSPALWLKADAGISASPVATWADQSGNGYDVSSSGGARPARIDAARYGLPVVRFDGAANYMARTGALVSQPDTIAFVCKSNDTAQSGQYIVDGTAARQLIDFKDNSKPGEHVWAGGTVLGPNSGTDIGNWHVYVAVFNGASSALYRDGTSVASGNAGTNALSGLTLGCRYSIANYFDGDLGEFLIFPSALSDANRQAVEAYLTAKWITPPVGPPTGGTWTATYNGETTSGLNWNATASQVQTALCALASLTPDKVAVAGDTWPVNAGAFTLTFADLGGNPPEVTVQSYLTGGDPTITPTTPTPYQVVDTSLPEIVVIDRGGATEGMFSLNDSQTYFVEWNASSPQVGALVSNAAWGTSEYQTTEGGPLDVAPVTVTCYATGDRTDPYVTGNTTDGNPTATVIQQGTTSSDVTLEIQTITLDYTPVSTNARRRRLICGA